MPLKNDKRNSSEFSLIKLSGFTSIEVLVTVVIIGIIGASILIASSEVQLSVGYVSAETNASAFTERNGIRLDSCMKHDTDHDGYKTCQAFDGQTPVTLQCGYGYFGSDSCYIGQPRRKYE